MANRRGNLGLGSVLALVGLGLVSSACGSNNDKGDKDDTNGVVAELHSDAARVTPESAESTSAGQSEQEFAFSFLQALDADANVAFSPHSMSTAFAMLTDAASGKTLEEVERVLHFGHADEAFHRSQDALELALKSRNRAAVTAENRNVDAQILTESNDVWIRDDLPPEASYLDTLARFYGAGVHHADFGGRPEDARVAINGKVSDDTHALIPELIPRNVIDSDTVTVLTNAMYFKAPWATALNSARPGDFHALDGATKTAQMMSISGTFAYYAGDGFVSVALPYYGNDLEMMLVVPDAGKYDAVRTAWSSDTFTQSLAGRTSETVELTLPKFDVKSAVPAAKVLQNLGMSAAFNRDTAEFPKLVSPTYPVVFISDVLHQATVSVDEKGTEASAATAIVLAGTSGYVEPPTPKVVNVDRPFLFVIRDNPTGAVLFVGQVVTPS